MIKSLNCVNRWFVGHSVLECIWIKNLVTNQDCYSMKGFKITMALNHITLFNPMKRWQISWLRAILIYIVKNYLQNFYILGSNVGNFNLLWFWILNFVFPLLCNSVFFALGPNFSFKSILAHCVWFQALKKQSRQKARINY